MRKTLKLLLVLLLTASLLPGMAACGTKADDTTKTTETTASTTAAPDATTEAERQILIGMIPTSIANNPIYIAVTGACEQLAAAAGAKFASVDVKMDASLQITAMENLMAQKADVIIIDPVDAKSIQPMVKKAMDQGIKIISMSGQTESYDSWMTVNAKKVGYTEGQMAAKWINDKLGGKAEVAILNYRLGSVLIDREDGMREALAADCPGAKIVAEAQADNHTDGMKAAENLLQVHPDLKVIMCVNDAGALGAVEAVKAAGKATDDFAVFGADSAPEALAKIKEGSALRGTVYIYPELIPGALIEYAMKLANGETVPKEYVGKMDGLTLENYDQIIKQ